jgi:hypothetical protein
MVGWILDSRLVLSLSKYFPACCIRPPRMRKATNVISCHFVGADAGLSLLKPLINVLCFILAIQSSPTSRGLTSTRSAQRPQLSRTKRSPVKVGRATNNNHNVWIGTELAVTSHLLFHPACSQVATSLLGSRIVSSFQPIRQPIYYYDSPSIVVAQNPAWPSY